MRDLVTRESWAHDDKPALVGWLQRMCRAAARDLPASGVGVSMLSDGGDLMTAAASGATSVLVEELQFTLGEGPCIAAYESRQPVLVPDLSAVASTMWPAMHPRRTHGVRPCSLSILVGDARLGALDVYRDRLGSSRRRVLPGAHVRGGCDAESARRRTRSAGSRQRCCPTGRTGSRSTTQAWSRFSSAWKTEQASPV